MNNPTDEWMDYQMPGSKLSLEHKIQAKSLIMMYKRVHLPRQEYREWLTKDIVEGIFGLEVRGLRVSNKTGIERGEEPYLYSYVILCVNDIIRTRRIKLFKWKEIQPEIRTLKNAAHVDAAAEYLDNWTYVASTIPRRRIRTIVREVPREKDVVVEVQHPTAEIMYASNRAPAFYLRDLLEWQVDVYKLIEKHCAPGYSFSTLPEGAISYHDNSVSLARYNKALELKLTRQKQVLSSWEYKEIVRQAGRWTEADLEPELKEVDEESAKTAAPEHQALRDNAGKTNTEVQYVNCGTKSGLTAFLQAIKYPKVMPDDAKERVDAIIQNYLARKAAGDDVEPDFYGSYGSAYRVRSGISDEATEKQFEKDTGNKIREHDPNRFLVIVGMPHKIAFLKAADEQRAKGWTGECVIFDLSKVDRIPETTYATTEAILDEHSCRSVWIFTRHLPDPKCLSNDRWKYYKKLSLSVLSKQISKLEPIETRLINSQVNGELPYGEGPYW